MSRSPGAILRNSVPGRSSLLWYRGRKARLGRYVYANKGAARKQPARRVVTDQGVQYVPQNVHKGSFEP